MLNLYENVHLMTYTDFFLFGLIEFFEWAKWLMLLALALVLADMYFGIDKARHNKEEVRKSRAWRRTLKKISDYVIWIILAYTFDKAFISFEIELLPFTLLIVIYGIELESILKNYFASRGKNIRINVFNLFKSKNIIEEDHETDK